MPGWPGRPGVLLHTTLFPSRVLLHLRLSRIANELKIGPSQRMSPVGCPVGACGRLNILAVGRRFPVAHVHRSNDVVDSLLPLPPPSLPLIPRQNKVLLHSGAAAGINLRAPLAIAGRQMAETIHGHPATWYPIRSLFHPGHVVPHCTAAQQCSEAMQQQQQQEQEACPEMPLEGPGKALDWACWRGHAWRGPGQQGGLWFAMMVALQSVFRTEICGNPIITQYPKVLPCSASVPHRRRVWPVNQWPGSAAGPDRESKNC